MKVAPALLSCLALAGCASVDPYSRAPIAAHLKRSDAVGDCARLFQRVDRAITSAGVRDVQAVQVEGFPYLRVDRLTSRLAPAAGNLEADRAWRERMVGLDREARAIEFANAGQTAAPGQDPAGMDDCRARLAEADGSAPALAKAAQVPDDYSTAMRALGLYPLTKYAFASGVRKWQEEALGTHATSVARLPRLGETVRYTPKPPLLLASLESLPLPAVDALGVPLLTPALTEALIARHAPAIEVDIVDGNDRLGQLAWGAAGKRVVVDTTRPVAYARVTYTRLAGGVVPQLVYTFWFPGRPAQSQFDRMSGNLDGLVWRVTLGVDLKPIVYDSIHPCGCYHLFYPTSGVRPRPAPIAGQGSGDEGLFVPQSVVAPRADERQLLHIAARTHSLQGVGNVPDESTGGVQYELRDENDLRVLPWPNESAPRATRSAYGVDGLIAGTERAERLFAWPTGITSVGQMRQWGHHATALVGRRHFDDPDLFDRYFEFSEAAADPR
jgi:hypothetical protein